jgi:hypothetical protein
MRRLIRELYAIGDAAQRSATGMSPNQATAIVATALILCLALGAVPACGSPVPKGRPCRATPWRSGQLTPEALQAALGELAK